MPIKVNCDFCNNSLDDRFAYLICSFKPAAVTPTKEELSDYIEALTNRHEAIYCDYKCLRSDVNALASEMDWDKSTKEVKKDGKRPKK